MLNEFLCIGTILCSFRLHAAAKGQHYQVFYVLHVVAKANREKWNYAAAKRHQGERAKIVCSFGLHAAGMGHQYLV